MARKGLTGQLNMFDLFKSLDDIPMGEVQMVSLMPEPEEELASTEELKPVEEPKSIKGTKPVEKPVVEVLPVAPVQIDLSKERPVMCRSYEINGQQIEIAYINYNKVRITRNGEEPQVYTFDSSKEAVDYYVLKMQELEPEE